MFKELKALLEDASTSDFRLALLVINIADMAFFSKEDPKLAQQYLALTTLIRSYLINNRQPTKEEFATLLDELKANLEDNTPNG